MSESLDKTGGRPLNILLVDDSEPDVKITTRAFRQARRESRLDAVTGGRECLAYLRREGAYAGKEGIPAPDIILLDINMPGMDGFELLRELKQDPQLKTIPVVMLTASKNPEDVLKSYQNGASSFIQKPVSYEDFVKVVDAFNVYWNLNRFVQLNGNR